MGAMIEHAKEELQRAGMLSKDSDYEGLAGKATLELVEAFERQGHSGFSAGLVLGLFSTLARFKALSPITNDPAEWTEVADNLWQSKRQSDLFSADGGKTGYSCDDRERATITFPEPAEVSP